jgi:hypothetical protein
VIQECALEKADIVPVDGNIDGDKELIVANTFIAAPVTALTSVYISITKTRMASKASALPSIRAPPYSFS